MKQMHKNVCIFHGKYSVFQFVRNWSHLQFMVEQSLSPWETMPHWLRPCSAIYIKHGSWSYQRIGIPMLKIRWSRDRLIFNMGIPIPIRRHLYIEMAHCWQQHPPPNVHFLSAHLMKYWVISNISFCCGAHIKLVPELAWIIDGCFFTGRLQINQREHSWWNLLQLVIKLL